MSWLARLQIDYTLHEGTSRAHHQHVGPLRILQSLYPEGPAVCHNVLVHPPGGLVGGDTLDLEVHVGPQAHGLLTTPGATRFYRSAAEPARQNTYLRLAAGARLEWLPLASPSRTGTADHCGRLACPGGSGFPQHGCAGGACRPG